MRKLSIIAVLVLFISPCAGFAQNCEDWIGVWEVDYADANAYVWIIETVAERDSSMFPCVVSGIQIKDGDYYTPFKIYWMDMGKKYIYTENVGEMTQTMPITYISLDGGEFTGDTGGSYNILSGKKTGDLCMTVLPNSVTIEDAAAQTLSVVISLEDAAMDGATVVFEGDCASYITVGTVSVDAAAKEVTAEITVAGDAASSVGVVVVKDAAGNAVCRAGFEIVSTQTPPDVVKENMWGKEGEDEGEFDGPSSVALDSDGNVYVVDTRNNRIQKFDADGYFIELWGTRGSGDGELTYPSGIAIDSQGNIYVVDERNYRIQKFDSAGGYITSWGPDGAVGAGFVKEPVAVAVDSADNVYVADAWQSLVQVFDADGNYISSWGDPAGGTGIFAFRPTDLVVDASGNILMTDHYNNIVQKFDATGALLSSWGGSEGDGDGEFSYPTAIDIDGEGNIYVVDTFNHRVQQFDADGNFTAQWGSEGSGDGELDWPVGIAVTDAGKFYVADTFNHRIQIFNAGEEDELCMATSLLGSDDPRLDTIRKFRDTVLADTGAGRQLISMYYRHTPGITAMLQGNPAMRTLAKGMIEALVPVMGMLTR